MAQGNRPQYSRVDLAKEIAKRRPDLHEDQAIGIIDLILAIVAEQVANGERVSLRGFGTFYMGTTKALKKGTNMPGGGPLARDIPARPCMRFKQSSIIKATMARRRRRTPEDR